MPPSTPEGTELVRKVAYCFEEIFTDDEDVIMFFTNSLEHFEDEFEEETKGDDEVSERHSHISMPQGGPPSTKAAHMPESDLLFRTAKRSTR